MGACTAYFAQQLGEGEQNDGENELTGHTRQAL